MIVVRCTAKLAAKLRVPLAESGSSTTQLGDWYASVLHTRRGLFVLAVAKQTLLPIVVTGRDLRSFPARLATTLADVLARFGVPADAIARECAAMSEVRYAKTDDRSAVGVLVDLLDRLRYDVDEEPMKPLLDITLRLATTPIVARDLIPDSATCRLFGVPTRRDRARDAGN